MTIRPVRDEDFETIAAITNHYIATSSIHFAYEPLAASELRATWAKGGERYPWLVTEEAGSVLGYAKASIWRDRAAYRWTAELGIYLAHDARGRGLGTTLYKALIDTCARNGFHTVIAGIALPNPPSLALHQALGFETAGVVRDAGYKQGAWHDVAFFQKRFSASGVPPRP